MAFITRLLRVLWDLVSHIPASVACYHRQLPYVAAFWVRTCNLHVCLLHGTTDGGCGQIRRGAGDGRLRRLQGSYRPEQ